MTLEYKNIYTIVIFLTYIIFAKNVRLITTTTTTMTMKMKITMTTTTTMTMIIIILIMFINYNSKIILFTALLATFTKNVMP